jgi:hypothetical protein
MKKRNYTDPEIRERNGFFYVHFQFRNRTTGCFEDFRINSPRAKHDLAYANELCRRAKRSLRAGYCPEKDDCVKHKLEERIFLFMGNLNWFEWLLATLYHWDRSRPGGIVCMFSLFIGGLSYQLVSILYVIRFKYAMSISTVLLIICMGLGILGALFGWLANWLIFDKRFDGKTGLIPKKVWRKANFIVISIMLESYIIGFLLHYTAVKYGLH